MYDLLKEFIKPELLILIPVLYLLGVALKKSQVKDKLIPWILGGSAIVLALIYIAATAAFTGWQSILLGVFSGVTQGALCAGASVYVNQLVKQSGKDE